MAGFTTTDDGGWSFSFADVPGKPELPEGPNMATNYLAGKGKWDNYSDITLYECEILLRKFFESKLDDPHWSIKNPYYRRFTCGLMFEILYGRKADCTGKDDLFIMRRLQRLMTYYSTRKQKEGMIRGKRYAKTVYTLSLKRYRTLKPYSLRLRVEWLEEHGEMPTWHNMVLPKDDLPAGHARNRQVEENMRRRRERAREIRNEQNRRRKRGDNQEAGEA